MHFHAFEHHLAEWFQISNTSFAAQLKDLPKLIVLKAKKIHNLKAVEGIGDKFLKNLICMDRAGQYQASSVGKHCKLQQLGPLFSVPVEALGTVTLGDVGMTADDGVPLA